MTNDQLDELERLAKGRLAGCKRDARRSARFGGDYDARLESELRRATIPTVPLLQMLELIAAARASSVGMSDSECAKTPPPNAGEGLACRCGRPYSLGPDMVLPDDVWASIAPRGPDGLEGILCPNCINDALEAGGYSYATVRAAFTSGPMADPTWRKEGPAGEGLRQAIERLEMVASGAVPIIRNGDPGLHDDIRTILQALRSNSPEAG